MMPTGQRAPSIHTTADIHTHTEAQGGVAPFLVPNPLLHALARGFAPEVGEPKAAAPAAAPLDYTTSILMKVMQRGAGACLEGGWVCAGSDGANGTDP